MSSPSYTSEDHAPSFNLGSTYPTHQLLVTTATTPDYNSERFLGDQDIGVGFYPSSTHQVAEAEVHIPSSASPEEVVSTSIRVHPDDVDTPKSSVVDPSPLATVATDTLGVPVETPSPIQAGRVDSPEEDKRVFYPTRNSAVRVTSLLRDSLQLPPGPRKRIVISSASSATSSCDASCDGTRAK